MTEVEEYISKHSNEVQDILRKIRDIIVKCSPDASESISYGMPGYKLYGKPLVYFAAFKNHIGLYATPTGHEQFAEEFAQYKQGKGSVQFPLNQQIPYELIERVVRFRVEENSQQSFKKPL